MRSTLLALMLLASPSLAQAGEETIKLKDALGKDAVEANCVGCHSLDYVPMNAPFLDAKGWEAEVTKMMKAFGAPVNPADVPPIVAYLSRNYGKR